jgi:hypothetical protein
MSRHLISLAAVLAAAGLVIAIVAIGVSSASGTPAGSVLAAPLPVGGAARPPVRLIACSFTPAGGTSAIRVGGACSGKLTAAFACVRSGEFLALSLRRQLRAGDAFYLTIVVPDFVGPGVYPESEAFAQIFGIANAPRWTDRKLLVVVDPTGSIELGRTVLAPEPGTPTAGRLTVVGQARCSADLVPGLGVRRP